MYNDITHTWNFNRSSHSVNFQTLLNGGLSAHSLANESEAKTSEKFVLNAFGYENLHTDEKVALKSDWDQILSCHGACQNNK